MDRNKRTKKTAAERAREYYIQHPERVKKACRRYYLEHKEQLDQAVTEYIDTHRERWNDCRRRKRLLKKEAELTEQILQIVKQLTPRKIIAQTLIEHLANLGERLFKTKTQLEEYRDWVDGRTLKGKAYREG